MGVPTRKLLPAQPHRGWNAKECSASLERAGLVPSDSDLHRALAILRNVSLLVIGDSTVHDKYWFLHQKGVREACDGGAGVCYVHYELMECQRPAGHMFDRWKDCRQTIARPCSFLDNRSGTPQLRSPLNERENPLDATYGVTRRPHASCCGRLPACTRSRRRRAIARLADGPRATECDSPTTARPHRRAPGA